MVVVSRDSRLICNVYVVVVRIYLLMLYIVPNKYAAATYIAKVRGLSVSMVSKKDL